MDDVERALAGTVPEPAASITTAAPRRCGRHRWALPVTVGGEPTGTQHCLRCLTIRDPVRSQRGKSARARGNAFERDVAHRLGARRVGQYGGPDDVAADWIAAQCKVGGAYPERIDGWLRAIPAKDDQLRAVVLGDAPGPGTRRRRLIVLDFDDFADWFGR